MLDSLGIGSAADADQFGGPEFTDEGAHTLGHIADAFARGQCDDDERQGPLRIPNLLALGLGHASEASSGAFPAGLTRPAELHGAYGWAREISSGKDTPSGHWELAGVPVLFDWSYFPDEPDCFPGSLLSAIEEQSGVCGSLGNCRASGTEIIARLGEDHLSSGKPIYYTSADSVFQIACHEEAFGLERLHALCECTREVLDRWGVCRRGVCRRGFCGRGVLQRDLLARLGEGDLVDGAAALTVAVEACDVLFLLS